MPERIFFVLLTALLMIACESSTQRLEREVSARLSEVDGHFAVAFDDPSNGNRILINAHDQFHAASTMKTPVMIEVYKQASAGKFSLQDSILIKNEFRSIADSSTYSLSAADDSETLLYERVGQRTTIYQLMYDMIIVSSNLATNIIIDLVGASNVMATMRSLGVNELQVLRGVEDNKAFQKGLNNTTTANDLMILFSRMSKGEIVTPEASSAMIDILLDQKFQEIIPARLPADVKVAHKTGSIKGVRHDSGVILLPDGQHYTLVLLSRELKDEDAAIKAMADVSNMIYNFVVKE